MDFVRPIQAVIPGVQGRILAVLAETTGELNLRTIALLADVSVAQASRIMPGVVELGIVERREAPPSALFRLVREHVAARAVVGLAAARNCLLDEMRHAAEALPVQPTGTIVFGSFARGEADGASDIDAVLIRPAEVDEDDDNWSIALEQWRSVVRRASGNRVEVLDVGSDEVAARLRSRQSIWQDIRRDGIVIQGPSLAELAEAVGA